jgi:hypothetical protein
MAWRLLSPLRPWSSGGADQSTVVRLRPAQDRMATARCSNCGFRAVIAGSRLAVLHGVVFDEMQNSIA